MSNQEERETIFTIYDLKADEIMKIPHVMRCGVDFAEDGRHQIRVAVIKGGEEEAKVKVQALLENVVVKLKNGSNKSLPPDSWIVKIQPPYRYY